MVARLLTAHEGSYGGRTRRPDPLVLDALEDDPLGLDRDP